MHEFTNKKCQKQQYESKLKSTLNILTYLHINPSQKDIYTLYLMLI